MPCGVNLGWGCALEGALEGDPGEREPREVPKGHPGCTREVLGNREAPGGTREAREAPGGTREAPGNQHPGGPRELSKRLIFLTFF